MRKPAPVDPITTTFPAPIVAMPVKRVCKAAAVKPAELVLAPEVPRNVGMKLVLPEKTRL